MASDKNTIPKGTTHIVIRADGRTYHAKRVYDGWCLQDGEGGWVVCGEEVRGYKVDISTGIVWAGTVEDNTRVLASVIRLKGERAIGVDGLRIPSGFSDVDHLITQRFVNCWEPSAQAVSDPEEILAYVHSPGFDSAMRAQQEAPTLMLGAFYMITGKDVANWEPSSKAVSGPINHVEPGKKIPALFSCPKLQELYDSPRKFIRKCFPVRAGVSVDQDQWMSIDTAPRDGRQLRLLVAFTENSTDDDEEGVTIGANYLEQNGLDEWLFAGWSWTQDCYTSGEGKVIGWLPLLSDDPTVGDLGFYGRMAARLRLKNSELNRDLAKAETALADERRKVDALRVSLRIEEQLSEGWGDRAQKAEDLLLRTLEYFTESGMPEDLLAEYKAVRGVAP